MLHNFYWHRRWTWKDRPDSGVRQRLLRFNLTTGLTSILGNLVAMWLLVGLFRLHPLVAGLLTIAGCPLVNFVVSDQVVFALPTRRPE